MDMPKNYLEQILKRGKGDKEYTEYQDMVNKAAKMCGQKYIIMHKRIERAFVGREFEFVKGRVWQWIHEAEKSSNAAITFNWRFKQFRDPEFYPKKWAAENARGNNYSLKNKKYVQTN